MFETALINCEINLILACSKEERKFAITDSKRYVLIGTINSR